MANTKVIKGKIKAIASIKKITKTMEMVAVSKMKKSVGEAVNIFPYIKEIKLVVNKIKNESAEKSIFFERPHLASPKLGEEKGGELIIIFATNKGLCGGFNANLFKKTRKFCEENKNIKQAICFGKFAEKIARKLDLEVKLSILEIEKITTPREISKVEKFARDLYLSGQASKIHSIYTNFIKMGQYEPVGVTLYPVDKNLSTYTDNLFPEEKGDKTTSSIYTFEPSVETLVENSIPKIIKMILFSYLLESRASENSSRSFAMKRANESAGELLGDLKISYNKIRQNSITQEIAEISAGAIQ